MGRRRKGNPVNGILLLDKREGVSSNRALQEVRRLYQAQKAGHTGSLDPLATGLLPVCFGTATRVSSFLLDTDKAYEVCFQLGTATATGDAEGEVIETLPVPDINRDDLNKLLNGFLGEQQQVPPMYSALKHNGKRLYELARDGVVVERKARQINIFAIDLLAFEENRITLRVTCSKGTYIRSLAEDIARALNTCGYVLTLRRIQVGQFHLNKAYTIEQLQQMPDDEERLAVLLPVDEALSDWPNVQLGKDLSISVRQGQIIEADNVPDDGWVRLYGEQDGFLGIGQVLEDGRLAPRRILLPLS